MKRHEQVATRLRLWYTDHHFIILIVLAFAVFRMMVAVLLRPGGYIEANGSINNWLYGGIGSLGAAEQYPFVDYWTEYPPVFPWLAVGLYRLSLLIPGWFFPQTWFNTLLNLAMVPFEVGNLILVYRAVLRLYGRSQAQQAAALYGLLFGPLFLAVSSFDPMVTFCLLLGMYGLIIESPVLAGIGTGVGFGVKLFTVVLIPAAVRVFSQRTRLAWFLGTVAVCLILIFAPLFTLGPEHTLAFFRQLGSRHAFQTIWALIDGFYGFGNVAPLNLRNLPEMVAWSPADYPPSRVPFLWVTLAFGVLGLFLYTRRIDWHDPIRSSAFVGLTLGMFMLYSKGHSPGWNHFLIAAALVLMPGLRGVLYATGFALTAVFDWPLLVSLLPTRGGMAAVVIAQAVLTAALCIDFAGLALPESRPLVVMRRWALPVVLAGIAVFAAAAARPALQAYTAHRLSFEPLHEIITAMQGEARPAPVIVAQPFMLERLQPHLPAGTVRLVPSANDHQYIAHLWVEPDEWLPVTLADRDRAWLIFDNSDPGQQAIYQDLRVWFDTYGCPISQTWVGTDWAGHYALGAGESPRQVDAGFEGGVRLSEAELPAASFAPGQAFCVRLIWQADRALDRDRVVFVHLLSADGALAAQSDIWPDVPTSAWSGGQTVRTSHGLWLPAKLAAGLYTLRAGLYDPGDGSRLSLITGEDGVTLGTIRVEP